MRVPWLSPDGHNPPPQKYVSISTSNDADDFFITLFTLSDRNVRLDDNTSDGVTHTHSLVVKLGGAADDGTIGDDRGWLMPVTVFITRTEYPETGGDPPTVTTETRELNSAELTFTLTPPERVEYSLTGMTLHF